MKNFYVYFRSVTVLRFRAKNFVNALVRVSEFCKDNMYLFDDRECVVEVLSDDFFSFFYYYPLIGDFFRPDFCINKK